MQRRCVWATQCGWACASPPSRRPPARWDWMPCVGRGRGLVDLVTIAPFWETSDFNMPVRLWRRLLDGTGVSLAGGLEILVRGHQSGTFSYQTPETAAGAAMAVLYGGADHINLFNFFYDMPGQPRATRATPRSEVSMTVTTIRFGVIGCGLMAREFASTTQRWGHFLNIDIRPTGRHRQHRTVLYLIDSTDDLCDITTAVADCRGSRQPRSGSGLSAVPHHLHAKVYGDVIRAGKHLIGEKPFGLDLEAFGEIHAAMDEHPEVLVALLERVPVLSRRAQDGRVVPRGGVRPDYRGEVCSEALFGHGFAQTDQLETHAPPTANTAAWATSASIRTTVRFGSACCQRAFRAAGEYRTRCGRMEGHPGALRNLGQRPPGL